MEEQPLIPDPEHRTDVYGRLINNQACRNVNLESLTLGECLRHIEGRTKLIINC